MIFLGCVFMESIISFLFANSGHTYVVMIHAMGREHFYEPAPKPIVPDLLAVALIWNDKTVLSPSVTILMALFAWRLIMLI